MPIFIAALVGGLVSAAGSMVGRILIALGVGYVAYTGLDIMLSAIASQVTASFSGMPALALSVLKLLKVDVCISIALSACSARLVLTGITSGKLTRMVIK